MVFAVAHGDARGRAHALHDARTHAAALYGVGWWRGRGVEPAARTPACLGHDAGGGGATPHSCDSWGLFVFVLLHRVQTTPGTLLEVARTTLRTLEVVRFARTDRNQSAIPVPVAITWYLH